MPGLVRGSFKVIKRLVLQLDQNIFSSGRLVLKKAVFSALTSKLNTGLINKI